MRGRVLSVLGLHIIVLSQGNEVTCTLAGRLKKNQSRQKNLVIVGDFVQFSNNQITAIEPRKTLLARQDPKNPKKQQLIAANIDQVLITASTTHPELKPYLIDRYIIATLSGGMTPIILINKIDLQEPDPHLIDLYRSLGYTTIPLSATTGENIDLLEQTMKDQTSVFSGQSGTGKSSLINATTNLDLPTGDLAITGKGAHTTTTAQLIHLPSGGLVIDTPGIKSFGLFETPNIASYYKEIVEHSQGCKFRSCTHTHEPECAVKDAVEKNQIDPIRYNSYITLANEDRLDRRP